MIYNLGPIQLLKSLFEDAVTWLTFAALIGVGLFLSVTILLLIGKLIRLAWGW